MKLLFAICLISVMFFRHCFIHFRAAQAQKAILALMMWWTGRGTLPVWTLLTRWLNFTRYTAQKKRSRYVRSHPIRKYQSFPSQSNQQVRLPTCYNLSTFICILGWSSLSTFPRRAELLASGFVNVQLPIVKCINILKQINLGPMKFFIKFFAWRIVGIELLEGA